MSIELLPHDEVVRIQKTFMDQMLATAMVKVHKKLVFLGREIAVATRVDLTTLGRRRHGKQSSNHVLHFAPRLRKHLLF